MPKAVAETSCIAAEPHAPPNAAVVGVRVRNFTELTLLFGSSVTDRLHNFVCERLKAHRGCTFLRESECGSFLFEIAKGRCLTRLASTFGVEKSIRHVLTTLIEAACVTTFDPPLIVKLDVITFIDGETVPPDADKDHIIKRANTWLDDPECQETPILPRPHSSSAIEKEEVEKVAWTVSTLLNNEVFIRCTPVCRHSDNAVLFHQCDGWFPTRSGAQHLHNWIRVGESIAGACVNRAVDEFLLLKLLADLAENADKALALRIGRQSATLDLWWDRVLAILETDRHRASRLGLIIQCGSEESEVGERSAFCTKMKNLGVRIIADRFGAEGAVVRDIISLKPDCVIVEEGFLHRAQHDTNSYQALRHIVGLTHALQSPAIVTGVDTPELAELAAAAGGVWQHGRFYGECALRFAQAADLQILNDKLAVSYI